MMKLAREFAPFTLIIIALLAAAWMARVVFLDPAKIEAEPPLLIQNAVTMEELLQEGEEKPFGLVYPMVEFDFDAHEEPPIEPLPYLETPLYDRQGLEDLIRGIIQEECAPKTMSEEGLTKLMQLEGFRKKAYWDHGQWTAGYGTRVASKDVTLSRYEALFHLAIKVSQYEKVVNGNVNVILTQNQFDALVLLAFNIGPHAFENSTILKKINMRDPSADRHFMDWIYAGGEPILVSRRETEREIYNREA